MDTNEMKIELPKNMDKDTEIDAINLFFNALPQDSYLRTLLQGFTSYAEEQIRNDWTINPLDTIRNLRDDLKIKENRITTVEESAEKAYHAEAEYKSLYEFHKELAEKNGAELFRQLEKITQQGEKIKSQAQEILELKAKLYDLMTGDKGDF